jgi:hypothetical protein
MHSPDHSDTVIIDLDLLAKQCQVTAVAAPRPPGGGRSTGTTAERPRAAELARTRRCGETTGPKITASSGVATRQPLRYPYGGR